LSCSSRCMGALFNPIDRAKGIKWGLVAHTTALMFSFVTIYTAHGLDLQSISYIDNREFPTSTACYLLDLLDTSSSSTPTPSTLCPTLMFQFNNWLADGLLVSLRFKLDCICVQRPRLSSPPALPLLRYLFHELLGNCLPRPDIPLPMWVRTQVHQVRLITTLGLRQSSI
jgi:hypothetical protein